MGAQCRGVIQVSQTSKTASVNEAVSTPCPHPAFPLHPPARPPPPSLPMLPCTVSIQVDGGLSSEVLWNRSALGGGSTPEIRLQPLVVRGCFLMGKWLEPYQEGRTHWLTGSYREFPKTYLRRRLPTFPKLFGVWCGSGRKSHTAASLQVQDLNDLGHSQDDITFGPRQQTTQASSFPT